MLLCSDARPLHLQTLPLVICQQSCRVPSRRKNVFVKHALPAARRQGKQVQAEREHNRNNTQHKLMHKESNPAQNMRAVPLPQPS